MTVEEWLLVGVAVSAAVIWYIPKTQVAGISSDHERVKVENECRQTLVQIAAAVGVLLGLYFTAQQIQLAAKQFESAKDAADSERLAMTIQHLESTSEHRRIAGLSELDSLANTSTKHRRTIRTTVDSFIQDRVAEQRHNQLTELRDRAARAFESHGNVSREDRDALVDLISAEIEGKQPRLDDEATARFRRLFPGLVDELRNVMHDARHEGGRDVAIALELLVEHTPEYEDKLPILSGIHVRDIDLRFASLAGWTISGTSIEGANLRSCDFRGAKLSNVEFSSCDLSGANFCDATTQDVIFNRCQLEAVQFDEKSISGVSDDVPHVVEG